MISDSEQHDNWRSLNLISSHFLRALNLDLLESFINTCAFLKGHRNSQATINYILKRSVTHSLTDSQHSVAKSQIITMANMT